MSVKSHITESMMSKKNEQALERTKRKRLILHVTVVLCHMEMQSASAAMNSIGQGHLVILATGHLS